MQREDSSIDNQRNRQVLDGEADGQILEPFSRSPPGMAQKKRWPGVYRGPYGPGPLSERKSQTMDEWGIIMGHAIFIVLHILAVLFGVIGLIITVPLHIVYAAVKK